MIEEIYVPVDGEKVSSRWPPKAERDLLKMYRWYATERKVADLAKILNKKYGRNWTANAVGKKAGRLGL